MSQEPVEVMEAVFAAISQKDRGAFLALAHREIEFHSMIAEAEGGSFRGHDGVRKWWDAVIESLDITPRPEQMESFRDRGVARVRVMGRIEGVEVPQTMWMAWRVRDRQVIWWSTYRTESEALEAAGLSE
jgi:ketosteroid isomerase-like protein